jgi:hypothetical protein
MLQRALIVATNIPVSSSSSLCCIMMLQHYHWHADICCNVNNKLPSISGCGIPSPAQAVATGMLQLATMLYIPRRAGTWASIASGCCNSIVATHHCAIYLGMSARRHLHHSLTSGGCHSNVATQHTGTVTSIALSCLRVRVRLLQQ